MSKTTIGEAEVLRLRQNVQALLRRRVLEAVEQVLEEELTEALGPDELRSHRSSVNTTRWPFAWTPTSNCCRGTSSLGHSRVPLESAPWSTSRPAEKSLVCSQKRHIEAFWGFSRAVSSLHSHQVELGRFPQISRSLDATCPGAEIGVFPRAGNGTFRHVGIKELR
jgi:hypothetical protein